MHWHPSLSKDAERFVIHRTCCLPIDLHIEEDLHTGACRTLRSGRGSMRRLSKRASARTLSVIGSSADTATRRAANAVRTTAKLFIASSVGRHNLGVWVVKSTGQDNGYLA